MITFDMPKETLVSLGSGAVVLGLWLGAYVWVIQPEPFFILYDLV